MKSTRSIMGMPITVEIVDESTNKDFDLVFDYFDYVDKKFSTYKPNSEISKINRREILEKDFSADMKEVFKLSEETKKLSRGYFNIQNPEGYIDPSGLVKGWAIQKASNILTEKGFKNFYVEAGGDIQVQGNNADNKPWNVGIKNPFNQKEIVKVVYLHNQGMATSGTYIRGQHIYNPFKANELLNNIVSLTVIGPNVYEADRFATAAFAMGKEGINFIESLKGFEGYMINKEGLATMTSGFDKYTVIEQK